jgi:hypothetical protein
MWKGRVGGLAGDVKAAGVGGEGGSGRGDEGDMDCDEGNWW